MGSPHDGPILQQYCLRKELRAIREARHLTQDQVAAAMAWHKSKVMRIESGNVRVAVNDLKALLDYFKIQDPSRVDLLLELARGALRRQSVTFSKSLSAPWAAYVEYEAAATEMKRVDPAVIPSLLCTEAYARAVLSDCRGLPDAKVDDRWRVIEARQHAFHSRPSAAFIIDECAIKRMIGGTRCLQEQLAHLRDLADRPGVSIQVMPFDAGGYRGIDVASAHLSFDEGMSTGILYREQGAEGIAAFEDAEACAAFLRDFARMEGQARSPHVTKATLDEEIARLTRRGGP